MLGMRSSLGGGGADGMKLPVQLLQTSEKRVFTLLCVLFTREYFFILYVGCVVYEKYNS